MDACCYGPTPTHLTGEPVSTIRKNVALRSDGAVATASTELSSGCSFWPARGAIDGDRKGAYWGNGGGWADGNSGNFTNDSLEIAFNGTKTIDEIDVFTVQDNYSNPSEPSETMTFSLYGLTAYRVDYWDGAAWTPVPGVSVTGNYNVWKKFSFQSIATTKIKLIPQAAVDNGYTRVTEVEAWGNYEPTPKMNVALRSNGASATASSELTNSCSVWPARGVIDGDRMGSYWANGGGWADSGAGDFTNDWIEIDFGSDKSVDEIDVFTLQDNYQNPTEPTSSMTFSLYGLTQYKLQYLVGTTWTDIPGASVTGNNHVWTKFNFTAVTTRKIRVIPQAAIDNGYSRITEVQAWSPSQTVSTSSIHWLVTDHLGTPRMIVDQTGSLANIKRHDYLPFGEELFTGVGSRTAGQGYSGVLVRQKFTLKERDFETDLDYFVARYYSSTQGRFTSPDEFKDGPRELFILGSGDAEKQALPYAELATPQSLNKYQYAYNNPLRYIDPDGHDVLGYELITSGPNQVPNTPHPEVPNLQGLGPADTATGGYFPLNLKVNFDAGDNIQDYKHVRTAIIVNNGEVRSGSQENPEKSQMTVTGQSRIVFDEPGIGISGAPKASLAGQTVVMALTAGEYNTKTKQLSSNMFYYAVKLVFDKKGALDRTQTVAVKLTRDQFIKLTEKHLPKDKKTKQRCPECMLSPPN